MPQAWIEFDVRNIEKATAELESQGYKPLIAAQKEPWGQVVTRLLGPEGLLAGIILTPSLRKGTCVYRRCKLLKIEGVSLHNYRYSWAERAKQRGYPERFAPEALGHNSAAVHRAYARKGERRSLR